MDTLRFFMGLLVVTGTLAFPEYGSLAGLSERDLKEIRPTFPHVGAQPPPAPLKDISAKLVNDAAHPWQPLRPGDIRGPCPGLNTLASHGYLPRNGIATPARIITAAQEGFNFPNALATFITYTAFCVDGNHITNLVSIGAKSPLTGPDPPPPATVAGFNTHNVFEGDTSLTRADAFFGDNHSFNETLFDQMIDFSNRFGDGNYNLSVASELKFQRIQDSIATNPNFSFVAPRYIIAYGEAVVPIAMFVDGRQADGQLDMKTARSFFQNSRYPDNFFRAEGNYVNDILAIGSPTLLSAHPVKPGKNQGRLNSYIPDPHSADFASICKLYVNIINDEVKPLYPNPTGALRDAIKENIHSLYLGFTAAFGTNTTSCPEIFPYGY